MIRDLMRQMRGGSGRQARLGRRRSFQYRPPHTHVVLRGRDKSGQDLILARQYISHGIRSRAQELVTLSSGPRPTWSGCRKLVNEVGQERLTRLDRSAAGAGQGQRAGYHGLPRSKIRAGTPCVWAASRRWSAWDSPRTAARHLGARCHARGQAGASSATAPTSSR